jgi:hypothetical protein
LENSVLKFLRASRSIFRIASDKGIWRVTREGEVFAAYWSEGDARRGACLGARRHEAEGGSARVVSLPGPVTLPHNQPHFGR